MKIVRPYAKIMPLPGALDTKTNGVELLQYIEHCARISHRAEDKQTDESFDRFLRSVVMDKGDWSVVEHVQLGVEFLVDRGVSHELVRHRLASYTQESTRFVNYEKKMLPSFVYPIVGVECKRCLSGNPVEISMSCAHRVDGELYQCEYEPAWLLSIDTAERSYRELLSHGWRPQEARSVFPNALATKIVASMNLRTWRHVFMMRTTQQVHPQMRQVMIPLLAEFKALIPILYEDIEPDLAQSVSIARAR
jgi:thymidylate synthase (FAD)